MPANTANLVHNQNDWNLPTHKHKSPWAEKLYQTSQILPPSILFFVVGGSLTPFLFYVDKLWNSNQSAV